jgi:argininosuccinate lyase
MQQRATDGFAVATEVANCLVHQTGMPFRGAHRRVGELVNSAIEHRESLDEAAWRLPGWREIMDQRDWLNPDGVVGRAEYGGGPASVSLDRILTELQAERKAAVHRLLDRSRQWGVGSRALQAATAELLTDSTLALSPP